MCLEHYILTALLFLVAYNIVIWVKVEWLSPVKSEESKVNNKLFVFFFFFFNFIFKLYIIVLILPNIKMNPPQVYMCSPSWTLLPPPSPYHPSGSSQCTSPKHPVWCIEPGLATRFLHDILHVSMSFSQIFPPSPSPRVHKTVLYISVSFAVLYTRLLLPSF